MFLCCNHQLLMLPKTIAFMNDEPLSFLFLFIKPTAIDILSAFSLKNSLRSFYKQAILQVLSFIYPGKLIPYYSISFIPLFP
ncbi:hypothetical protein wVul_0861 [Wolbachia endosymbiont of Armadillidium vulgare str. wVulC]|nr:hypothetical protein wVul_0861 [Wolbachia endosymbiont of Armadillidium vulgare str. wVulC]